MLNAVILLTSLATGIGIAKWIPTDWIEDLFGAFGVERFAIIGKIVIGAIGFLIGFACGKFVFYFLLIYLVALILKKK